MKKEKNKFIWNAIITVVIILILFKLIIVIYPTQHKQQKLTANVSVQQSFINLNNETRVVMNLPAVDGEGMGVITQLIVEKTIGTGRTLTDIDNLLFWADTQHSIRIAKLVAGNITGKNLNDYNFVYNLRANASLIGGPSAGAALTLATVSALLEKPLKNNVMITGSINSDGTIGPVQEILAKAKVAKKSGVNLFLVPLLQSGDVVYETVKSCQEFGTQDVCTNETRPKKVNITEEAGIEIVEVSSIQEAMKYFF